MRMGNPAIRYFLIGQTSLYLSILICVLLRPAGLEANDGVSYYSSQALTVGPFSLGLLLCAWFVYKVPSGLPRQVLPQLKNWTTTLAALMLIVVLVPYAFNDG